LIILINKPKVDAVQVVVHHHLPFKCPAFWLSDTQTIHSLLLELLQQLLALRQPILVLRQPILELRHPILVLHQPILELRLRALRQPILELRLQIRDLRQPILVVRLRDLRQPILVVHQQVLANAITALLKAPHPLRAIMRARAWSGSNYLIIRIFTQLWGKTVHSKIIYFQFQKVMSILFRIILYNIALLCFKMVCWKGWW
jgi:hypothetical protein